MDVPLKREVGHESAGVEFVGPSVTSDGFYELVSSSAKARADPDRGADDPRSEGAVAANNPWVRYLGGIGHGFVVLDVTPERVHADDYLTTVPTSGLPDPRVDPTVDPAYATSWRTQRTTRRAVAADGPVGRRHDEPHVRKH
ncbi:MAG: hypothetical protein ACRYG2_00100 [Janthinobacterium lividum]